MPFYQEAVVGGDKLSSVDFFMPCKQSVITAVQYTPLPARQPLALRGLLFSQSLLWLLLMLGFGLN